MKKILIPSLIASSFLFASDQNYIELGAGFLDSENNFSTESSKSISTLGSASSETDVIPNINFLYKYNLNNETDIYTESSRGILNFGILRQNDFGTFNFGFMADFFKEEWENPFLTGTNRNETDTEEYGIFIAQGFKFSQNINSTIKYSYSEKDYDSDTTATDLKRKGDRNIISLQNMFMTNMFNNMRVLNNISYEIYDADGESSSYDEYKISLGVSTNFSRDLNMVLIGDIGKKEFDRVNSVINKKIESDIYGVNAILTLERPFGFKDFYTSLTTGYSQEEANDVFYDKETTYALIGVGYRF